MDIRAIEAGIQEQIALEKSLVFDEDGYAKVTETEKYKIGFHTKSLVSTVAGTQLGMIMRSFSTENILPLLMLEQQLIHC